MKTNSPVVRLELDRDQVMLLLSAIEMPIDCSLTLDSRTRSFETLREMVERAGRLEAADDGQSFFVLKLAPIYAALLQVGANSEVGLGESWVPESDVELADAEQDAIACLDRLGRVDERAAA